MGLDTVELVIAVEEAYGITIPDEVAPNLVRLGDLHGFILQTLQERGEIVEPVAIWERLKFVVRDRFAIRERSIVPEARIVSDLGLD